MKSAARGTAFAKSKKLGIKPFLPSIKGILAAIIFTAAAFLILALLLKTGAMGEGAVAPLTQVVKVLAILLAAFLTVRKEEKLVWLKGGAAGGVFMLLGWLISSLIVNEFGSAAVLFADIAMGLIIGGITGLLMPVFRKREKAK